MYGPVVQSALDLDYPPGKLTVWVLDDGRKESVQEHVKVPPACSLAAAQPARYAHAAVAGQLSLWWHWLPALTLVPADMALFVMPTSVASLSCPADSQLQQRCQVHVPAAPHWQ